MSCGDVCLTPAKLNNLTNPTRRLLLELFRANPTGKRPHNKLEGLYIVSGVGTPPQEELEDVAEERDGLECDPDGNRWITASRFVWDKPGVCHLSNQNCPFRLHVTNIICELKKS